MIGNFRSPFDDTALNKLNLIANFVDQFDGTRLYEVSYNLFDTSRVGIGSVISSNGSIDTSQTNFRNTGFIPLEPGVNYVMSGHGMGAFYDENYDYVSGFTAGLTNFKAGDNVRYMNSTLARAQVDTFMVHAGLTLLPYKEYGIKPSKLIIAPELQDKIDDAMVIFGEIDGLTINRGKDFPLKSVQLGSQEPVEIAEHTKNVILDAKVSGAKPDMFYRITFIANGHLSNGKVLYGISLGEYRKSDGFRVRWVFTYNDANTPENQQNYNIEKGSDGIDTIMAVRDDIVVSVTVDRAAITASSNPTFLNLNSGIGNSPSAVIAPSTYSAF